MSLSRRPAIWPLIALAALLLAATLGNARPVAAAAAPHRAPSSNGKTRRTECPKAKHRGRAKRAASKRACQSAQARHTDPAQPTVQALSPVASVESKSRAPGPGSRPVGSEQQSTPTIGGETPFRFFSPSSFWNSPLAADAPLDAKSTELVGAFDEEIDGELRARGGPWIDTTDYSVPVYSVPAEQPTVRVQLVSRFSAVALQAAWNEVPLPPDALPAAGTDGVLVLWQPSTDRLWEFWRLTHTVNGWQAAWGGAMQNVSANAGVYDANAWPGAKPWWGSSASSLSSAGGLITLEDLQGGQIDHALALAIPDVRAGVYASPAQRSDGLSSSPRSLPEGAHLRLDPGLDLATLHLPPLTMMIAQAAQRYGIFVRDRARNVHFFAQDPVSMPSNPYAGPGGYFEGKSPARLLASFPWDHLQLINMELHAMP